METDMTEDEQIEQMIAEEEAQEAEAKVAEAEAAEPVKEKPAKKAKGVTVTKAGSGKVFGADGSLKEGEVLEGAPDNAIKALKELGFVA